MTEHTSEQLIYEKNRLEGIISSVDSYLSNPEVTEALKQSVQTVANQIVELYTSNPDKEFSFVVGGKSRRVTERMLQHVTNALPEGHPARKAIKDRLRLNDQQNKNLYGESTTTQTLAKKVDLSPLQQLSGENKEIIVFDDNMQSGRKVYRTLTELGKVGINATYIVFSGPKEFLDGHEYLRPDGWKNLKQKVKVGTDNQGALKALTGLSDLLSSYTNVRLNRNVSILGVKNHASIDTLEPEHAKMLRRAADLIKKLDEILS